MGGWGGGGVCDADSLLVEDHQQRGAQTPAFTLMQYAGIAEVVDCTTSRPADINKRKNGIHIGVN